MNAIRTLTVRVATSRFKLTESPREDVLAVLAAGHRYTDGSGALTLDDVNEALDYAVSSGDPALAIAAVDGASAARAVPMYVLARKMGRLAETVGEADAPHRAAEAAWLASQGSEADVDAYHEANAEWHTTLVTALDVAFGTQRRRIASSTDGMLHVISEAAARALYLARATNEAVHA